MQSSNNPIKAIRQQRKRLRQLRHIHADVMAVIRGEAEAEVDIWAHYKELKHLRGYYGTRILFREALIGVLVHCRIHPKIAHTELSHLQRQCGRRNDAARFNAFAAAVDTHLLPDVLTPQSYQAPTFATMNTDQVWQSIKEVMDWLETKGFQSFLNSGTLLGVTRDGDLLDHDNDVDLAVIMNGRSMKTVLRDWVSLTQMLRDDDMLDVDGSAPEMLRLKARTGFTFDLFPAWSIGKKFYVYPHTPGTLMAEDVLPLKAGKPARLAIPRRPVAMLKENYGANWKVPDRFFRFPWRQAYHEFGDFLSAVKAAQQGKAAQPLAKAA